MAPAGGEVSWNDDAQVTGPVMAGNVIIMKGKVYHHVAEKTKRRE